MGDAALDEARLDSIAGFMADCGSAPGGPLAATMLAGGRSNVTYRLDDGHRAWVLRRPPFGALAPSAHDVGREHRVTTALAGTAVPVATPVGLCEDTSVLGVPFTIAAFVDGTVVRTVDDVASMLGDRSGACVDALVAALVDLHEVDVDAAGLGSLGRRTGYGERQLRTWTRQWDLVATGPSADADRLAARLRDVAPERDSTSVVHGDYRIDNVMLDPADPTHVVAVVDWELCTLGDPVADIASTCAYRDPALDLIMGFPAAWTSDLLPDRNDIASRYERLSGRSLDDWEFYLALAFFKIAVISQGIHHRYLAGATRGEGFDRAGEAVPELLATGLRILDAG